MQESAYDYRYIWLISLAAALGGFLFGYDWVVVGGARPFYEPYFGLDTPELQGWGVSSALIGCFLGAVLSGLLSDRLGRKRLLIAAGMLFTVSAIGTGLAGSFTQYNLFRVIGGGGIGLASNLSPMYIAEVSPAHVRGRFVSVNQLAIVVGLLAAQVVNWLISLHDQQLPDGASTEMIRACWNGQCGWRWMFGAETVPALAFVILMFLVPESPRWLIKSGRQDLAERVLCKIGNCDYGRTEVVNIQKTISSEETACVNFRDLLEPKLLKLTMVGVILAFYQQWCGIDVIFYYATDIFKAAGYGLSGIMLNIVITGIVMLFFTFVAIVSVDRIGRRKLVLVGSAGLAITHGLIGAAFYFDFTGVSVVLLTLVAIAFYSFSLAPIVWVLLSELFPNRIRGAAMSISVSALWIGCFTLSYAFPILNTAYGTSCVFWIFGMICLAGFAFVALVLPETKGKSLEQIEQECLG